MRCLRNILKIKWQDRIPDTQVLKRAGTQSLYPILRSQHIRWLGHVARMDNSRIPRYYMGNRVRAHITLDDPSFASQTSVKHPSYSFLLMFSINFVNWDMVAQDRVGWRAAVLIGAKSCELNRVQHTVDNRQRGKWPTVYNSTVFYYCRHFQKPRR